MAKKSGSTKVASVETSESASTTSSASRKAGSSSVKENEQDPNAVGTTRIDLPNAQLPEVNEELERQKARGQTESQKQERAYYEGRFQTHEPTAQKERDAGDAVRQDAEK